MLCCSGERLRPAGDANSDTGRYLAFVMTRYNEVAAAAGYRQVGAGRLDAGSRDFAGTNPVPCLDNGLGKIVSDITNRRETCLESHFRICDRDSHIVGHRALVIDSQITGVVVIQGDMRMCIDQPR